MRVCRHHRSLDGQALYAFGSCCGTGFEWGVAKQDPMTALLLTLFGLLCFGLFFKCVNWFEKI